MPLIRRRARARGRPRNAEASATTRIDILKSAAASFRRLGYHGATVEEIAAALRMKKGNLYYYFRNKEDILFACHQYSLDRLHEILDEVERSGVSPEEQLRRLVGAFVRTILDELHGTALFLDLEALSPAHLRTVIERRDRFDRGIRRVIESGMRAGVFAPGDAKLITFAILGAVNWIPRWFHPAGTATWEQIAETFSSYLIAGLKRPLVV
jgi:AcrR family transcriptional regulator